MINLWKPKPKPELEPEPEPKIKVKVNKKRLEKLRKDFDEYFLKNIF